MTDTLRFACIDSDAPPLFLRAEAGGARRGFEPAVADLLSAEIGRRVEWALMPWAEMIPAVQAGSADAVLCGQGITPAREEQLAFTRPYAIFHESVLVRSTGQIRSAEELAGRRVAAIDGSTNMTLAMRFPGAVVVGFDGSSGDIFGEMLDALRTGEVDAVVDDDVACAPLDGHPDFHVAFTVRTGNRWGIGVAKHDTMLLGELNSALEAVVADGRLEQVWRLWLPGLDYSFTPAEAG